MKPIRIFISSPGDVAEEREKAKQVVAELQRRYADRTRLEAVLWEDLPLGANASFQEGIDLLLNDEQGVDIAVFVIWSRLGTPLGGAVQRPDGTSYRSGTEREFELMLEARKRSGGTRPHILAYVREDERGFKQRLSETPANEIEALLQQRRLAEAFIAERFRDQHGRNVAAYHTFPQPATFAARLERHLTNHLDDLLRTEAITGTEAPYRGLEVFDREHAPIFHGRDTEAAEVVERLQHRVTEEGVGFVVIVGASGSGKSSLARAGVSARIEALARDEAVAAWRPAAMVPGAWQGQLLRGLVQTLVQPEVLPGLRSGDGPLDPLVNALRESPVTALPLILPPAVRLPTGQARVLLLVDQLEELFTDRAITADERRQFLAALEALAASGHCWIVATLRSDFYAVAQQEPAFVKLKGGSGHYDLLPPAPAAIAQIIQQPARLAGLRFEYSPERHENLHELLLEDALKQPDALPLLEYTLRELYEQRGADGLLTFAAYEALGGVEGALGKRAEAIFQRLPPEVQAVLPRLLVQLVTVDAVEQTTAVRRRAPVPGLGTASSPDSADPHGAALVTAFVRERLLTADREGDQPTLTLAHEALLRSWPRLREWFASERDFLRVRARVSEAAAEWDKHQRHPDYLLSDGRPLAEAMDRLKDRGAGLDPLTGKFLTGSEQSAKSKRDALARRRRTALLFTSTLAGVATLAALAATFQWRTARTARDNATTARDQARAARAAADELANYILFDLRDKLTALGRQDLLNEANRRFQAYQKQFGHDTSDLDAERNRMVSLVNEGDILKIRGGGTNLAAARLRYDEAMTVARKLAAADPANVQWQTDLVVSLFTIGVILSDSAVPGERPLAMDAFREARQIIGRLQAKGWLDTSQAAWPKIIEEALQAAESPAK